jgi:type VI secretion system protein VasJ
VERRFEDGAPAADPPTRAWAEGLRRRNASPEALLLEHDADVAARLQWAHAMLQDGRGPEAMALALGLSRRAPDGRGRYLGMLAIVSAALASQRGDLVGPVLADLRADVERHQLETWEPRLCIPLYAVLLACAREGVLSIGASESESDLYARLYRLDPVEALRQARK